MSILVSSVFLIVLFAALGLAADLAVRNIKYIANVLQVRLFAFGILLGLITTLPELSVGINAAIDGATGLSAGNLLGGVIVIFGLVLGASLMLNRQVKTDGDIGTVAFAAAVIFLPILLGIDGSYGLFDGLAMVGAYSALVFFLYRSNRRHDWSRPAIINRNKVALSAITAIIGIVLVLLCSNWIVDITLRLLEQVNVSRLVIGALVFAIGTNLPEISIAITSWRKKTSELSLNHLLSSAFSNTLVLGILAMVERISFRTGSPYLALGFFMALILTAFLFFYQSGRKIDRREGACLLSVYGLFLLVNFWLMSQ